MRDFIARLFSQVDEVCMSKIVAVCWSIWNSKIKRVHGTLDHNWRWSRHRAISYINEYATLNDRYSKDATGEASGCTWSPPPSGLWKLNVDVAQVGESKASWGVVVCDFVGDVVAVGCMTSEHWRGAELKEAAVLFFCLKMSWGSGYRKVLVEGDCLSVISKLKKRSIPNWPNTLLG